MTDKYHSGAPARNNSRVFPITTFQDRDDWIRLMLAADGETLPAIAKVICARIALHLNVDDGQCNPKIDTLVAGTGLSKATIYRWLLVVVESGWIGADRTGGRHRNCYELRVPTVSQERPFNGLNTETVDDTATVSPVRPQRSHRRESNGLTAENPYRTANRTAKRTAERVSPRLDLGDEGRREVQTPDSTEADFAEFYAAYPKQKARPRALKAYRAALKKPGVTPAVLLAGAHRAAAAYQQDVARRGKETALQYFPQPSSWLADEGWADEPATTIGVTLDGDGNLVRPPQHQQRSWMDIAMGDLSDGVLL